MTHSALAQLTDAYDPDENAIDVADFGRPLRANHGTWTEPPTYVASITAEAGATTLAHLAKLTTDAAPAAEDDE